MIDRETGTVDNRDPTMRGDNTPVLFYKTFPTVYNYIKLGKIDGVTGLAATVGSGDETMIFEWE